MAEAPESKRASTALVPVAPKLPPAIVEALKHGQEVMQVASRDLLADPEARPLFVIATNKMPDEHRVAIVSALNHAAANSKQIAMSQKRNADACRKTSIPVAIGITILSVTSALSAAPLGTLAIASLIGAALAVYGTGEALARRWDQAEFDSERNVSNIKDTVAQIRGPSPTPALPPPSTDRKQP